MSDAWTPYRPRAIAALNAIGRLLAAVGLRSSLAPDSLIAAARRRTGLDAFGDPPLQPALDTLTAAIDRQAALHPFGRWVIRKRLIDVLSVRLRVEALFRRYPEIDDIDIGPPLVIAGLQRTGTTMLHRLLAADPDTRALLSWEAIDPLPRPGFVPGRPPPPGPDPRIKAARVAEKGLAYLAPEFFAIHPVEAEAPEEDVLLLEFALCSQVPEATLNVPDYAAWRAQADPAPAYAYLHRLLKLLHWQRPARRWVLKTPAHLEHLDTLLAEFPGARIIQTHRDPQRTVASFSSMLAHGYGVFSDRVDAAEIAGRWTAMNAAMVARADAVRAIHPEAFIDVHYHELVRDPMAQVRRIYDFAGLPLTDAATAAMDATRNRNTQHKYGRHHYTLADFGLDAETVDRLFGDYRARYDIPQETA